MPVVATNGMGQSASIVETLQETDLLTGLFKYGTFTLSDFPRASAVAPFFKFYRAARVVWTYEPLYNTFQDVAGALSKPYIYIVMNRSQEAKDLAAGFASLQATGARPRALTKNIVVSYRPNWCSPGVSMIYTNTAPGGPAGQLTASEPMGLKVEYAWLQTPNSLTAINEAQRVGLITTGPVATPLPPNTGSTTAEIPLNLANCVQYNGHVAYVDQSVPNTSQNPVARLTCSVHWEFKGAKYNGGIPTRSLSPLEVQKGPMVDSA